ncbi:MAG: helix-hairpin-helix domain-containing protein [Erythrobacter sp.]|nr:helix-hairpin-helix domain-containing protein [Erythrobacter sp.]
MMEMIEANWPLLLVAFVIGLAIAWFLFNASRRTKVTGERSDVLDEGAAPAARNQALIDSAPAASATAPAATAPPEPAPAPAATSSPAEAQSVVPPATPMGLAGAGAAVSAGVEDAQERRGQGVADDPAPTPATSPATDGTVPTPADGVDDLTRIKGVGPKLATALRDLGITSFAEIASWDDAEIDRVDAQLGRFQGRIRRDDWVTQARLLAGGDRAEYEAKFGRLD